MGLVGTPGAYRLRVYELSVARVGPGGKNAKKNAINLGIGMKNAN